MGMLLACNMCVLAAFDLFMPPLFIWVLIALIAFWGPIIIADHNHVKIDSLPGQNTAAMLTGVAALLGLIIFGPLLLFIIALLPIRVYFELLFPSKRKQWGATGLRAIKYFGIFLFFAVLSVGIYGYKIKQTRKPAEFIVSWGNSGIASVMMEELESAEPSSLDQYRYIVDNGRIYNSSIYRAAERIALIGDPDIDEARLSDLLKRARKDHSYYIEQIEKAFNDLRARKLINRASKQTKSG